MAAISCKPNISVAGKRRRRGVGYVLTIVGVAMLTLFVIFRVPFWCRALLFFPAAFAAVGFLQASRDTCVAHAARGTFEHDDFSTTKAPDDEVEASRKVAATIRYDALLIGFVSGFIACATGLLR